MCLVVLWTAINFTASPAPLLCRFAEWWQHHDIIHPLARVQDFSLWFFKDLSMIPFCFWVHPVCWVGWGCFPIGQRSHQCYLEHGWSLRIRNIACSTSGVMPSGFDYSFCQKHNALTTLPGNPSTSSKTGWQRLSASASKRSRQKKILKLSKDQVGQCSWAELVVSDSQGGHQQHFCNSMRFAVIWIIRPGLQLSCLPRSGGKHLKMTGAYPRPFARRVIKEHCKLKKVIHLASV